MGRETRLKYRDNSDPAKTVGGELTFERLLVGFYRLPSVTVGFRRRTVRKGELWCEGRW